MRKINLHNLFFVLLAFLVFAGDVCGDSDENKKREMKIKAAFVYNFIQFVDWPKDKMSDDLDKPIVIGAVSVGEKIAMFDKIKDKKAKGRRIIIKYFENSKEYLSKKSEKNSAMLEEMKKCHIICFCDLSADEAKLLLEELSGSNILTIGNMSGFLEYGGKIGFVIDESKLRFEVNLAAAKADDLKISSELLKLARRVVVKDEK